MASARSLTTPTRLFSTSLRRHRHLHHTAHPLNASSNKVFKNPFGVADDGNGGPRKISDCKIVNNSLMVMRFDGPGLTSKSLKVWVTEDKSIGVQGGTEARPKFGDLGLDYIMVIPGYQKICQVEQVKAEVKNGVLWLTLPIKQDYQRALNYYYNKPPF